ncbi:hypothetical protein [Bordetella petrii]|uniref:hypothetical protein n=1 Tax=Bordetella petrii TaxID=94624 RepID=UPI001E54CE40|nr:hypothetical protein [Bordetella petrii]MCD0506195.1 hypothetical protein [Bordetella petrii]
MGVKSILAIMGLAWLLAGCSTSGRNFDSSQLSMLTPGVSTLEESAYALGAAPAVLYGQSDGGTLALWSFKASFVNDGLYSRKQALLQFGPDGRLVRLVDTTNVLLEPWERRKLLGPSPAGLDGPPGAAWTSPAQAVPVH